jgi:hypothetical protein
VYHGGSVPAWGYTPTTHDPFGSQGFQATGDDLATAQAVEVTIAREPVRARPTGATLRARRTTRPTRTTRRATSRRRASTTRRAGASTSASRDDGGPEPGPCSHALPTRVERSAKAVAR